jgi:hypothetical protein
MTIPTKTSLEELFAQGRLAFEQRELGLIDGPDLPATLNRLRDNENAILRDAMASQLTLLPFLPAPAG